MRWDSSWVASMHGNRTQRSASLPSIQWLILGAALIIGVIVPLLLTLPPRLLAVLGMLPAAVILWVPELAVVLMQDALGIVQSFTRLIGIPIESGFAFGLAGAALLGYILLALRHRLVYRAILSPLSLATYALVAVLGLSILRSGPQVGLDKFLRFAGFNLLGFLLASLTPAPRRRWLVYGFIPVGAAGIASVGLALTQMPAVGRLTAFGGNPIWTSRLLCVAGLVMLWWPNLSYWIRVPAATAFFIVAVFTGSRGPLLTSGLIIAVALLGRALYARRRHTAGESLILFLGMMFVAGAGFLALRAIASEQAAVNPYSPFVRIFAGTPETEASTETRLALYQIALEQFGQNPLFGIGLGGMVTVLQTAGVVYPHNLFLEFASETGIIGLLLHALGLILAFFGTVPYLRDASPRTRADTAIGLMLFLFALLNAQVSGDMVGNKMLWFFMGYLNGLVSEKGWGVPGFLRRRKVLVRKEE